MLRTEESKLTSWYFEIDRKLLVYVLVMMVISVICMISAGSVAAERIGQPWNYYIVKAIPFYFIGVVTLLGASMLNTKWVMRISWLNVAVGLLLLLVTLVAPHTINGSDRFVSLGFANVMPADIMKPGFIIITAWFLAKMRDAYGDDIFFNREAWRLRWLSWWPYLGAFSAALLIIFSHPDLGTALLYLAVLCAMLFISGLPLVIIPAIALAGLGLLTIAFFTMSHVHNRIISFFTGTGDTYQVTQSIQSIQNGGLFGQGDGSFVKQSLPDAHTDFIFAAVAEDMGAILACVLIVFLMMVLRRLIVNATAARDKFVFYATGGAAALFGTQVCINLMSTLHLFAPKGMTLPFISYGGSSLLSFCLLFGMIMAIVREDKWK